MIDFDTLAWVILAFWVIGSIGIFITSYFRAKTGKKYLDNEPETHIHEWSQWGMDIGKQFIYAVRFCNSCGKDEQIEVEREIV